MELTRTRTTREFPHLMVGGSLGSDLVYHTNRKIGSVVLSVHGEGQALSKNVFSFVKGLTDGSRDTTSTQQLLDVLRELEYTTPFFEPRPNRVLNAYERGFVFGAAMQSGSISERVTNPFKRPASLLNKYAVSLIKIV